MYCAEWWARCKGQSKGECEARCHQYCVMSSATNKMPTMAHQGKSANAPFMPGASQAPSLAVLKIARGWVMAKRLKNIISSSLVSSPVAELRTVVW